MDKNDIISKIYFDRSGYGSKKTTLADAKKVNKNITTKDVDEFFKKTVAEKKQLKGYNSFIAPHAYYEFQMDLFFIKDIPDQKWEIGLLLIDIFSKYCVIIPIETKGIGDVVRGILEGIQKMGKKPSIIYSDDETALRYETVQQLFRDKDIKHIVTRSHAWFAERMIRTVKDMLYKRIDNSKKENPQWTDFLYEVLLTYNNKLQHSSHGMTPNQARQPKNEIEVKLQLLSKQNHTRLYPMLEVSSKVKILRKKKPGEKERTSVWMDEIQEVISIGTSHNQTYFKLKDLPKQYLRNEVLKVV